MINLDDVQRARSVGCTTAAQKVEEPTSAVDGMFVTYRNRHCGKPAAWVCEWLDTDSSGRHENMLGAACAEHHESIVAGEWPLFDSMHQPVLPDWYKLPADPAEDAAWLAELLAAANPFDHQAPEREAQPDE